MHGGNYVNASVCEVFIYSLQSFPSPVDTLRCTCTDEKALVRTRSAARWKISMETIHIHVLESRVVHWIIQYQCRFPTQIPASMVVEEWFRLVLRLKVLKNLHSSMISASYILCQAISNKLKEGVLFFMTVFKQHSYSLQKPIYPLVIIE